MNMRTMRPLHPELVNIPGGHRQRTVIAGAIVFVVVIAVAVAGITLAVAGGTSHRASHQPPAAIAPAGAGLAAQAPATVPVSQSPVQVQTDQQIAQAAASQATTNAEIAGLVVPSPAIAGGWPRLAAATTPEAWAAEFVAGLLDVNYRDQSRADLGAWLMAQSAPNLLPGIPAAAAGKVLFADVLDSAGGPPEPSTSTWAADAQAGARQTVADLLVQADPDWQQLIATGWQPPDTRMDGLDVSGVITVTRGTTRTARHFTVGLVTGSAAWHPGYGTVSIAEWAAK